MNAPAEQLFTRAGRRRRDGAAHGAGQRRALLVVHRRPAGRRDRPGRDPARRDRADEPDDRRADAGRGDRRQGAVRARRADRGRHHPARPPRGARARAALRAAEDRRPTSCRCAFRRRPPSSRRRTSCCGGRRSSSSRRRALKSQFLANMSHEFRTPLNAILGYTHMLLQGVAGDLPPTSSGSCTRIDSNGRHLLTIINEILDISRIEAGKMPLQISEFNLNELVPEVMAELDPVIARSKLAVTPQLSPELPIVLQRPPEGEADPRQPAEQRAEVHAPRRHRRSPSTFDRASSAWRRSRSATPASASHRSIRRRSSRTSGRSTTRRRGSTAAPASGLAICRRLAQLARRPHHAAQHARQGLDVHPDDSRGSTTMTDQTCAADSRRRRLPGRPRDVRGVPAVLRLPRRRGAQRQRGAASRRSR